MAKTLLFMTLVLGMLTGCASRQQPAPAPAPVQETREEQAYELAYGKTTPIDLFTQYGAPDVVVSSDYINPVYLYLLGRETSMGNKLVAVFIFENRLLSLTSVMTIQEFQVLWEEAKQELHKQPGQRLH
jgi:hypothetical protein